MAKQKKNVTEPFYDHHFHQWCINYTQKGGVYGAVWGDTEEECIERYKEIIKK